MEYSLEKLTLKQIQEIIGLEDKHLKIIENNLNVEIILKENFLYIEGNEENCTKAAKLINLLEETLNGKGNIDDIDVVSCIELIKNQNVNSIASLYDIPLAKNAYGKSIYPKTFNQKRYINFLKESDITFGIGPAGTGKTYLAVVYAVSLLKKNLIKRIVLTRPAVEAGESLGFLPGDLKEKVDPYLKPLYDALYEMLGEENTTKLIEKGTIEIAPLAYMRGRTLNDAYIILDEAQNTTRSQMKMFLTRLGFNAKMVITGDISQIDLPSGKKSGLIEAIDILNDIEGISIMHFSHKDVVRHYLVGKIIEAYENNEKHIK